MAGTEQMEISPWISAVVVGVTAGALMGLWFVSKMPNYGALYGFKSATAGWAAHFWHSALFGVIFGAVVTRGPLREYASKVTTSLGLGIAYGTVLWLVNVGVILPIWFSIVGLPSPGFFAYSLPNFLSHLTYGVVLGALYPLVWQSESQSDTTTTQTEQASQTG